MSEEGPEDDDSLEDPFGVASSVVVAPPSFAEVVRWKKTSKSHYKGERVSTLFKTFLFFD